LANSNPLFLSLLRLILLTILMYDTLLHGHYGCPLTQSSPFNTTILYLPSVHLSIDGLSSKATGSMKAGAMNLELSPRIQHIEDAQ
jgi:hypothetical protein